MKTPASIFAELLEIDPTLAPHKTDIMKAIKTLQSIKPDTKFDAKFAAKLKKEFAVQTPTPTPSGDSMLARLRNFFSPKILV